MRWRGIAWLVLIVAGLATVLLLTQERPTEHGSVSVSLLDSRRLVNATLLRWQFADQQPFEVRRGPDGRFHVSHPVEDLASAATLGSIAQTYDSAMVGETPLPDTEENRARTGLDAPRCKVEVEFADGYRQQLEIGAEGPLGTDVFVRRDGRIWRGGLALLSSLQVTLDDLRERTVFRTPVPLAREVVVDRRLPEGGRELLRLQRQGDDWRLTEPIAFRADPAAAESFVRTILSLRIDLFFDGPVRLPDGKADLAIAIRSGDGEETLDLWIDDREHMTGRLADRRIWFRSLSQYAQAFKDSVDALRSRKLTSIGDPYQEMATMVVDFGGGAGRLAVRRESAGLPWRIQEPLVGPAEQTAVNELLTAVNNLRAMSFLPADTDPVGCGFRSDGLSISMQGFDSTVAHRIRFGGDARFDGVDVTHASREVDGAAEIVLVPRGAVDVIRRGWTSYVPLQLFRIDRGVSRVELLHRDGRRRELLADAAGVWSDAAGQPVDSDALADYVERLRDLTAKRVLLVRDAGLAAPDWSVRLLRRDDPSGSVGFGSLDVWDRAGQPLLVRDATADQGLAAELSPTMSHVLRQLWQ